MTTEAPTEMTTTPHRAAQLQTALTNLTTRLTQLQTTRPRHPIRLVLVSKLKPASDILCLHRQHPTHPTHFGENYVPELLAKAAALPPRLRWHFIGGLQSNKARALAGLRNLWCVSSVDSVRKADLLEGGRAALVGAGGQDGLATQAAKETAKGSERETGTEADTEENGADWERTLRVMVQINTSGEPGKAGVAPGAAAVDLCRHIVRECPHLRLSGVMTIGALARSRAAATATAADADAATSAAVAGKEDKVDGRNEDFTLLVEVRDEIRRELGGEVGELEVSMGMSADYEMAIAQGSDEVRIGSTIFGERPPKGAV
jgi:hypothetical protein